MANNPNQISYIPSIEGLVIRPVSGDIEKKSASETNMDYANLLKTLESRFATKSDVGHTHDDRYYTEGETDLLLEEKPDISILALPFDEEFAYLTGSYVSLGGKVYRYITDHQPGPFDIIETEMVTIGGELEGKSDITHNHNNLYAPLVHTHTDKADNAAIAPVFRDDMNYAVGDVVAYEGGLYRYLTPHTAGDWNRSEVVVTNAISEGGGGGGGGGGVGDEITFDGNNMIITSSDRSIESIESSIAIVASGNTHPAITAGQYVYVKLHDTLGEGLYIANSDIGENVTLSSTNLSGVPGGGFNRINSNISTINSNINAIDSSLAIVSNGNTHAAITAGQYVYVKNHGTLAEGLYTANSSISQNVALSSSNVTSVNSNGGGFNRLLKYVGKPIKVLQIQFNLPQAVTVTKSNSGVLLDHYNLHNVTSNLLGPLPDPADVLVGMFPIWCNSIVSAGVVMDTIVWGPTSVSLTAGVTNWDSISISAIRLLTFWETNN